MEIYRLLKLLFILNSLIFNTIGEPYEGEQEVILVAEPNRCNVEVDFSSMGLNSIRKNFITGSSIRKLSLRDNLILEFQENTFEKLPNLEYLDISSNKLSKGKLFSFGSVPSLKTLIADNNIFTEDASTTNECLDCSTMFNTYGWERRTRPYTNLEMSIEFPEVTYLSLRNIFMDSISSHWGFQFPRILVLDVSLNQLTSFEDFFESLPLTVENLTMQDMGLTTLRLKRSRNFTSLDLSSNNFEILSSYCYQNTLCLKNLNELEALYIADCSVKRIETDAFKDAQKLLHLDLSNNELNEIPEGTFEFLPSLLHLDISGNSFTRIPNIGILNNLRSLKMDNIKNHFFITSLNAITPMPNLRTISLRKNSLKHLPSDFFTKLQGLQEIDLSHNQLTRISHGSWQENVKKLALNQNFISDIEDLNLNRATSLELLELEGNNITNIKLSVMKKLPDTVTLKL